MGDDPKGLDDQGTQDNGLETLGPLLGPEEAPIQGAELPPPNPEGERILAAAARLRHWNEAYTLPGKNRDRNTAAASATGIRAGGPPGAAHRASVNAGISDQNTLDTELNSYYRKKFPRESFQNDKETLRKFLAAQAKHMAGIALDKRELMLNSLKARYGVGLGRIEKGSKARVRPKVDPKVRAKADQELDDLAQALAKILVYRSTLPLCLTQEMAETVANLQTTDWSFALLPRPTPATETEIRERVERDFWRLVIAESFPDQDLGIEDLTDEQKVNAIKRYGLKLLGTSRVDWRKRSTNPNESFPYVDKRAQLAALDGIANDAERLELLDKSHPIILAFGETLTTPYELADILRLTDIPTRRKELRLLVEIVLNRFSASNRELAITFKVKNPLQIDFGAYRPALEAAATFLTPEPGGGDLGPALENAYYSLDRWKTTDIADSALMVLGLALLVASFVFTGPVGTMVLGVLGGGSTAGSLVLAAVRYHDALQSESLDAVDKVYSEISGTIEIVETEGSSNIAMLGFAIELLGAIPFGRMVKFLKQSGAGPAADVTEAVQHRLAKGIAQDEVIVIAHNADEVLEVGEEVVEDALDASSDAATATRATSTSEQATTAQSRSTGTAPPAAPVRQAQRVPRREDGAIDTAALIRNLPEDPPLRVISDDDRIVEELLSDAAANARTDTMLRRLGLLNDGVPPQPGTGGIVQLTETVVDPRLRTLVADAKPYSSFENHDAFLKYAQNEFERTMRDTVPDAELDALYEEFITSHYGREVAERGRYDTITTVPAPSYADLLENQLDSAVRSGRRLHRGGTTSTINNAIRPDGVIIPSHQLNIAYEVIDAGDVNGVPSVYYRIVFKQSEFDAIGIGNYSDRFIERYAQTNETIAYIVDQTDAPPMLLPSAVRDADVKTASSAFSRHLNLGTGYKLNVDEALQRSWSGFAIDLNQRAESDLINKIYSHADAGVARWARDTVKAGLPPGDESWKNASIGIAGVMVEFQ